MAVGVGELPEPDHHEGGNTVAATNKPAGVGGSRPEHHVPAEVWNRCAARDPAVAVQQTVQVLTNVELADLYSRGVAGEYAPTNCRTSYNQATVLSLVAGAAFGGRRRQFTFVPKGRRWLATAVQPRLKEVARRHRQARQRNPNGSD